MTILDFETFRIDFDRRQLTRGNEEVHLSPKALQLLQVMVQCRPKAIAKADLQKQLWPVTFVVESSLAGIVAELRRALDDDAHAPKYIRTVHAFGYAFCGEPRGTEPADRRPVAKLVWDRHHGPLFEGRNVIGREPEASVRVDDRTISRQHAVIFIEEQRATLEDLQSKNGTLLEGTPVNTPVELRDGAVLELGSVRMVYQEISTLSTTTLCRGSGPGPA